MSDQHSQLFPLPSPEEIQAIFGKLYSRTQLSSPRFKPVTKRGEWQCVFCRGYVSKRTGRCQYAYESEPGVWEHD